MKTQNYSELVAIILSMWAEAYIDCIYAYMPRLYMSLYICHA